MSDRKQKCREHCHHIIAFLREPGSPWMKNAPIGVAFVPEKGKDGGGGGNGDFLAGYAPGTIPQTLKPQEGQRRRAGLCE